MNFSLVSPTSIPATIRTKGKWLPLWKQVLALSVDGDWLAVKLADDSSVQQARTAVASYCRRAKPEWAIETRTSKKYAPNTLYIGKVSKTSK